jgi:hypothetical protein
MKKSENIFCGADYLTCTKAKKALKMNAFPAKTK